MSAFRQPTARSPNCRGFGNLSALTMRQIVVRLRPVISTTSGRRTILSSFKTFSFPFSRTYPMGTATLEEERVSGGMLCYVMEGENQSWARGKWPKSQVEMLRNEKTRATFNRCGKREKATLTFHYKFQTKPPGSLQAWKERVAMRESTLESVAPAMPTFATLENWARSSIQDLLQRVLEEEVTARCSSRSAGSPP